MKIFAAVFAAFCMFTVSVSAAEPALKSSAMPDTDQTASLDDEAIKSRLIFGPERWAQIHALVQAGVSTSKTWDSSLKTDGTAKENKDDAVWSKDLYLKTCRLSLNGQLSEKSFFFLQTEDLTAGKSSKTGEEANDSNGSNKMFTQDAYIKFAASPYFQMYAGLLVVPRDRQNMLSQATLISANGLSLAKSMDGYSNNGRDTGIMFRGAVPANKPIMEYRLGVFRGLGRKLDADGKVARNKNDLPRVSGRIQLSAGEAETGYFYHDGYLGKRALLSFGLGGDYQPDQFKKDKDYTSFASDVHVESPFSMQYPMCINGDAGFIKAFNCPDTAGLSYDNYLIFYAQLGLLIDNAVQPVLKFSHRSGSQTDKFRYLSAGLNYYLNGHFSNIKMEFEVPVSENKNLPGEYKATVQFQGYL